MGGGLRSSECVRPQIPDCRDEDLFPIVHWSREVHGVEVRLVQGSSGGVEGVNDSRACGDVHDARVANRPGDVNDEKRSVFFPSTWQG